MPIVKARSLDKYGIINDIDPFDLPPEAWSFGQNVRFRNGRVQRGPVFRSARVLSTTDPRFVYGVNPTSGLDTIFVGYTNGRVFLTSPTAETDYSPAGYVNSVLEGTWSGCHLADIVYINRDDRVPWYLNGTAFAALPNWNAAWTTKLLRSCGGALVALNVTKTGVNYPTMVKTSSFPTAGTVPASWDQTVPSTLATENILAEMEGPIVDAQTFGNNLVIYGHNQAWLMQKVSSFDVFDYFKLPFQKGAINANCVVEVDGKHYVFGPDDIWVHDGVSEKSICDQRNRRFIFSSMSSVNASKCFVLHNPLLNEISFCYPSADRGVGFTLADGCNKAAVYNYGSDTWSFDDLPYVYSGSFANLSSSQTYNTITPTYATMGGSYLDLEDGYKRTPVFVGRLDATYSLSTSLYAFDLYGDGSTASFAVDTHATKGAYLERDGIDLDQFPDIQLSDYKLIRSIIPLARLDAQPNTTLEFDFGTSDYFGQYPAMFDGPVQTYDGNTNYQLDYNMSGRWISLHIKYNDYTTFSLSGLDLDVDVTGRR